MAKPDTRKIRFERVDPRNEPLFENFKQATTYDLAYYQSLENFLKFTGLEGKILSSLNTSDVENYRNAMWDCGVNSVRTDLIIEVISTFKNYLIKNHSFPSDFLSDIKILKVNEKSSPDNIALTLVQLAYIRDFNQTNQIFEYLFELLFQLGIDKKDLLNCLPNYADKNLRKFVNGKKQIGHNEKINLLLAKQYDTREMKRVIKDIDALYFKKITYYLREEKKAYTRPEPRQINYSDILKTHEIYILKCPNHDCNELVENTSHNWVLVQTDFEKEYRLFCNVCKGKSHENN